MSRYSARTTSSRSRKSRSAKRTRPIDMAPIPPPPPLLPPQPPPPPPPVSTTRRIIQETTNYSQTSPRGDGSVEKVVSLTNQHEHVYEYETINNEPSSSVEYWQYKRIPPPPPAPPPPPPQGPSFYADSSNMNLPASSSTSGLEVFDYSRSFPSLLKYT